jgi:hypothetical protein
MVYTVQPVRPNAGRYAGMEDAAAAVALGKRL